jgi:hypothetical protein
MKVRAITVILYLALVALLLWSAENNRVGLHIVIGFILLTVPAFGLWLSRQ